MHQWFSRIAAFVVLGTLLSVAPASADAHVYVRIAPPHPVVEVQTRSPHPNYVWREGYHRWDGHRYVWVRGTWVRPPYARARWTAGRWTRDRHGFYYVPGHWSRA